ncbi:MAG: hypothetical protein V3T05_06530 [Myxococcota bacterium]
MPTINKPTFPTPSVQDLKADLDKLDRAIQNAKNADGTVNVSALEAEVQASGDLGLKYGIETIKDVFHRTEVRDVSHGCGGRDMREIRVDPEKLESGEVVSLLQALVQAKSKVDAIDSNHDGSISKTEADHAGHPDGIAEDLADNMLDGALASFKAELHAWRQALTGIHESIKARKDVEGAITRRAGHHAQTAEGAEAITWAYRDMATRGTHVDRWSIDDALENAETSFLRYIPLFGIARRAKHKEGHLSDSEVRRLFGTDDLSAFIADTKAAVEGRVGNYQTDYLTGKDIAGADGLRDPDFTPIPSAC